jgi:lysophospholipase L1-like esterase
MAFQRLITTPVNSGAGTSLADGGDAINANFDVVNGMIQPSSDAVHIIDFTDVDGWSWGWIQEDGSLYTPGYSLLASVDAFVIIDEDGWIVFDATDVQAAASSQPWSGLKALSFGDSITQTGDVDNGDFGFGFRANWPIYASTQLATTAWKNYAKSGASFREYTGQLTWQAISHQINTALTNGETPDFIVLSCGTNDALVNLGDYATAMGRATLADLDMSNTAEAMRWALWSIRTNWPAAKCFYVLPLQRADVETSVRQPLLDLLTQMAERYSFVVIDAHHQSDIVKDFEVWGSAGRDLVDGLHPMDSGQKKMSNLVTSVIRNTYNH